MARGDRYWLSKPAWVVLVAIAGFLGCLFALRFIQRVDRTLDQSRKTVAQQRIVPLRSRTITPQTRFGFKLWSSVTNTYQMVVFKDRLFAASNQGLQEYDLQGLESRQFTVLDGLPSNQLQALAKTPDALWIAVAPQGLLRFDGSQFEFFLADQPQDFEVTALLPLDSGTLLLGTKHRGLLVFRKNHAEEFSPQLRNYHITCLQGDDRQLAIGTFHDGIFLYRQGVLTRAAKEGDSAGRLVDNQVTTIAAYDQNLYMGTPLGINEIKDGQVVRVLAEGAYIRAVTVETNLLAATDTGWIHVPLRPVQRLARTACLQPALFRDRSIGGNYGLINQVLPMMDRWLVATDRGVFETGPSLEGRWVQFGKADQDRQPLSLAWNSKTRPSDSAGPSAGSRILSDSNVSALSADRDQNFWVGYFDHGLDFCNSQGQQLKHYEDDRIFCVNYISSRPNGQVMVSTANGLAIFQNGELRQFITEKDGLLHKSIAMTLPLSSPDLMLAATAEGISILQGFRPFQNFNAFHGLANNHVYAAAQLEGRIYLGTLGGISIMENGRISSSWNTANSGLKANWVNALAVCSGKLFVGTYGGGVQSVNAMGHWTDYTPSIGKFEVNANAMAVDGTRLYVGSLDQGVLVYDGARDQWRQIAEPLPSRNVTSFAFDSSRILVGTDNGLLQIEKSEIEKLF